MTTSLFGDLPEQYSEEPRAVVSRASLASLEPESYSRPGGIMVPVPPSSNRLWRIFGNRVHKSSDYKKWLKECCKEHSELKDQTLDFPVELVITLRLGKGFVQSRDLSNVIKPCEDLLKPTKYKRNGDLEHEGLGLIKDDNVNFIRGIRLVLLPPYDKQSEAEFYIDLVPTAVEIVPPPKVRQHRSKKK